MKILLIVFKRESYFSICIKTIVNVCCYKKIKKIYLGEIKKIFRKNLKENFNEKVNNLDFFRVEEISEKIIPVLRNGSTGSVWILEGGSDAFEHKLKRRDDL